MAKRFSLIDMGGVQVVKAGFLEPASLLDIQEFLELAQKTSQYEEIDITILHLLFLDYEDAEVTDATEEEVEILQDKLPEFYDFGCIIPQEEIEIEGLYGVLEDEELIDRIF